MTQLILTSINIYPIKSLGGISLTSAIAEERGLKYDRRWMLINESNIFISQRDCSEMALITVQFAEDGFALSYKQDPSKHVILMSYGTGSVGLNLQFTNYVFLFDRWWNPAVEDQAINRAHRIGQTSPVTVTRFVIENSIEQRIAEVLEAKRRLFNELLEQNGPPPVLGLTEDEIFGLFDIKRQPKK